MTAGVDGEGFTDRVPREDALWSAEGDHPAALHYRSLRGEA